ncbi:MAG TPA: hypothetical protein VG755_41320 [Nannocystaceae bacterium]|nr:hypothetical protein [Nannocystaceae bacterium]
MERRSLHALFTGLLLGCGPSVHVGDGEGTGGSTGTTTSTTGVSASTTTTGVDVDTGTTGMTPIFDVGAGDGPVIFDMGIPCEEQIFMDDVDIPLSTIASWIDDTGQIAAENCSDACHAADLGVIIVACHVEGAMGGSSSGDGSSSSSESGSTTGDPIVTLHCEWTNDCMPADGRGHAAVRSTARAHGDDVGRWVALVAHAEAASVGAFLALRHELRAHDAPQELCDRALAAARDEVGHARAMGRIAARRGIATTRARFARAQVRTLEAIAIENAVEGCVRETWCALRAMAQSTRARDPELRRTMQRIAIDETRHAELAHDLARWLEQQLDDAARDRVRAARDAAVAQLLASLATPLPARMQRDAGLPDPATARTLAEGLRATLWS